MDAIELLHGVQALLGLYREAYRLIIEAAVVIILCYIGITDFRTYKIRNESLLVLLVLYVLYAIVARSFYEILANVVLALAVFGVMLWLYRKGAVGGGDVKLIPAVCLWVGARCALPFSILLLFLVSLHLIAVRFGWVAANTKDGRLAIAYGPSVAGALIGVVLLGCL